MNYGLSSFEHKKEDGVKIIGTCKHCSMKDNTIYDNQLFVELENESYHFLCYNEKAEKENE